MVTIAGIKEALFGRKKELELERKRVEAFEPGIPRTKAELLAATPLIQARIRELQRTRGISKEQALRELGIMEEALVPVEAEVARAEEAQRTYEAGLARYQAQQREYQIAEDYYRRNKFPVGESKRVQEIWRQMETRFQSVARATKGPRVPPTAVVSEQVLRDMGERVKAGEEAMKQWIELTKQPSSPERTEILDVLKKRVSEGKMAEELVLSRIGAYVPEEQMKAMAEYETAMRRREKAISIPKTLWETGIIGIGAVPGLIGPPISRIPIEKAIPPTEKWLREKVTYPLMKPAEEVFRIPERQAALERAREMEEEIRRTRGEEQAELFRKGVEIGKFPVETLYGMYRGLREEPLKIAALTAAGYGLGKVVPPAMAALARTERIGVPFITGAMAAKAIPYGIGGLYVYGKGKEVIAAPSEEFGLGPGAVVGEAIVTEIAPIYMGAKLAEYDKIIMRKFLSQQKALLKDIKAETIRKKYKKKKLKPPKKLPITREEAEEMVSETVAKVERAWAKGKTPKAQYNAAIKELTKMSKSAKTPEGRQEFAKFLKYLTDKGILPAGTYNIETGELSFIRVPPKVTVPPMIEAIEKLPAGVPPSVWAGLGLYERYAPGEEIYPEYIPPALRPKLRPPTPIGAETMFTGIAPAGKIEVEKYGRVPAMGTLGRMAAGVGLGVALAPALTTAERLRTKEEVRLREIERLSAVERARLQERQRLAQPLALGLGLGLGLTTKQLQRLKQVELQKLIPKPREPVPRPRPVPRGLRVPPPTGFYWWLPESERRRLRKKLIKKPPKKAGWNVYGKQIKTKRYKKLNIVPLTKTHAKSLGAYIIDRSLSTNFKLKQVRKNIRNPLMKFPLGYFGQTKHKYRDYKIRKGKRVPMIDKWIERRGPARLDTPEEKKKITLLKKHAEMKRKARRPRLRPRKKRRIRRRRIKKWWE